MLRNLPQVTKNLLLLNITVYIMAMVLVSNQIPLGAELGSHYVNSMFFKPYQIVSHMFMHSLSDPFHIFMNMFLLVMFGGHLERVWGAKRYFIFYISCGLGAFVMYNSIGVWQLYNVKNELISQGVDLQYWNSYINDIHQQTLYLERYRLPNLPTDALTDYMSLNIAQMAGASGAIFGLLAGFAMLFPNTQLFLIFIPIPIKAKYLIGVYLLYEVYNSIINISDGIAHLAHVGGAVVGIIFILVWRKRDRSNFF